MPRHRTLPAIVRPCLTLKQTCFFTVSKTCVTVTLPLLQAIWWNRPRGSASDTSVASLLIPAILRPSTLRGFVVLSFQRRSAMLGFATCQETTWPGRRHNMDKETGCTLCPGRWSTTLLDPVFRWGLQQRLGFDAPGAGQPCGRTPRGASDATICLILWADMLVCATRVSTHGATTACVITLRLWPARRD